MQNINKHANNSGLIIGGISLSLLGILGLALNRVLNVLKGRKDASMSRYGYPSRPMICAPAGNGTARAPVRDKKKESCPPSDDKEDIPFVSPVKRSLKVTAAVTIGGRVVQPPIDEDDVVYFDG